VAKTTLSLAVALALSAQSVSAHCSSDVVDLRWDGGSARFSVEIADDDDERAKGLMFRETMGRYNGMLFIYDSPASVSFWMKNTLIPLDMVFLDKQGIVTHLHENAIPLSLEPIPGGEDILAVLEVNGGLSKALGLVVGAEMRHPAFAQNQPFWPCE